MGSSDSEYCLRSFALSLGNPWGSMTRQVFFHKRTIFLFSAYGPPGVATGLAQADGDPGDVAENVRIVGLHVLEKPHYLQFQRKTP
jgi:hypothetical protein